MKIVKMLKFVLIGCFLLVGCDKNNSNSKMPDALENSALLSGTIASYEENTEIRFSVSDDKIEVLGEYCGEPFETVLTDETTDKFINEICNYLPTLQAKEDDYWPHVDGEYPDLAVLFNCKIVFDNEYVYKVNGSECYPDDWDKFIDDLVEIIGI